MLRRNILGQQFKLGIYSMNNVFSVRRKKYFQQFILVSRLLIARYSTIRCVKATIF